MGISLSNESKSKVSLSNDSKGTDPTWEETDPDTWADSGNSSWGSYRVNLQQSSKSKISLSNESK